MAWPPQLLRLFIRFSLLLHELGFSSTAWRYIYIQSFIRCFYNVEFMTLQSRSTATTCELCTPWRHWNHSSLLRTRYTIPPWHLVGVFCCIGPWWLDAGGIVSSSSHGHRSPSMRRKNWTDLTKEIKTCVEGEGRMTLGRCLRAVEKGQFISCLSVCWVSGVSAYTNIHGVFVWDIQSLSVSFWGQPML